MSHFQADVATSLREKRQNRWNRFKYFIILHPEIKTIGSEDGDGHRGSLKLGDNMQVYAGQNPSDADKNLFPFETRVPACFFRPYARIVASK